MIGSIGNGRYIILLFSITLLFMAGSCSTIKKHKGTSGNVIVYRVFDSLEQILCEDISKLQTGKDTIAILIEPGGDFRVTDDTLKDNVYIYRIKILREFAYKKDSIFDYTTRKIQICGNLYPVYFPRIDDVFCQQEKYRNRPYRHNRLGEPWDIYRWGYVEVNMSKKKIIFCNIPQP